MSTRGEPLYWGAGSAVLPPRPGQASKGMGSPRHSAAPGNIVIHGATRAGRVGGTEEGGGEKGTPDWAVKDG